MTVMEERVLTPPERSLQQRQEALKTANRIRTRRAQLKRDLKAGRVTILPLIADPPEYIETMKIFDLLLAAPRYGRVKVNKVLKSAVISPSKTVGGLSERQRGELLGMLRRLDAASTARRADPHGNVPVRLRETVRR